MNATSGVVVAQLLSVILHFIHATTKPRQSVLIVAEANTTYTTLITTLIQHGSLADVIWSVNTIWTDTSAIECATIIFFAIQQLYVDQYFVYKRHDYLLSKSVLVIGSEYARLQSIVRWHRNEYVVVELGETDADTLGVVDVHEVQPTARNAAQYLAHHAPKSRQLTHVSLFGPNDVPDSFAVRWLSRAGAPIAYVGWLHYLLHIVGEQQPLAQTYSPPVWTTMNDVFGGRDAFMFQDINTTGPDSDTE